MKRDIRILVVGGTGAVGRHVCREVERVLGVESLIVGDYNQQRGVEYVAQNHRGARSCRVDVRDRASVASAVQEADAVILAARQPGPVVQAVCTDLNRHSIDIVPDTPLDPTLRGVVAAGLIPGLSGLLARETIDHARQTGTNVSEVDVALLQRRHGTAGAAGIADMLGLFSRPVAVNGRTIRGFSRRRRFELPEPFGRKNLRRVAFPEVRILRDRLDLVDVLYWTAFDDPVFNGVLGAANRLGILGRIARTKGESSLARMIARGKQEPSDRDERVVLTAEAGPIRSTLVVPSDYGGTAMVAVAIARACVERGAPDYAMAYPFELFSAEEILDLIRSDDVIRESTAIS